VKPIIVIFSLPIGEVSWKKGFERVKPKLIKEAKDEVEQHAPAHYHVPFSHILKSNFKGN